MTEKGRRNFLGYAATGIVCGAVAGVGGYFAGQMAAPPPAAAPTVTETVEKTVTAPAGAPPRTIKMGATVPMTGVNAPPAGWTERMYKEWANMVNQRGGIYVEEFGQRLPMEFVLYDSKSDPATSEKFYERLITEDRVDVLFGPYADPECAATKPIAEKYEEPMIIGCGGAADFYKAPNPYIMISTEVIANWLWNWVDLMKKDGNFKTAAFVWTQEPFSEPVKHGFDWRVKEQGDFIDIVVDEAAPIDTADYTAQITKVKTANPDVTQYLTIGGGHPTFFKQMKELGYKPKMYNANPPEALVPTIGWEELQNVTSNTNCVIGTPFNGVFGLDFYHELFQRIGIRIMDYPDVVSPDYMSLEWAYVGIEAAGTLDKKKLNEAYHSIKFMAQMGPNYLRSYELMDYGMLDGVSPKMWCPIQARGEEWVHLWTPRWNLEEILVAYPKTVEMVNPMP